MSKPTSKGALCGKGRLRLYLFPAAPNHNSAVDRLPHHLLDRTPQGCHAGRLGLEPDPPPVLRRRPSPLWLCEGLEGQRAEEAAGAGYQPGGLGDGGTATADPAAHFCRRPNKETLKMRPHLKTRPPGTFPWPNPPKSTGSGYRLTEATGAMI